MTKARYMVTINIMRDLDADLSHVAQRYPMVERDQALKKIVTDEVTNCIKAGRLSGDITEVELHLPWSLAKE